MNTPSNQNTPRVPPNTSSDADAYSSRSEGTLRPPSPAERLEALRVQLEPDTVPAHRWIESSVEKRLDLSQDRAYRAQVRRMLSRDDVGQEIGHQLLLFEIDNLNEHKNTNGCQFLNRTRALLVEVAAGDAPTSIAQSVRARLQQLPEEQLRQVLIPARNPLEIRSSEEHLSYVGKVATAAISLLPAASQLLNEVIARTAKIVVDMLVSETAAGVSMLASASTEARVAWTSHLQRMEDPTLAATTKKAALRLVDTTGCVDSRVSSYPELVDLFKEVAASTRREQASHSASELRTQLQALELSPQLPAAAFDTSSLIEALNVSRGINLLHKLLPSPEQLALAAGYLARSYQEMVQNPALDERERVVLKEEFVTYEATLTQHIVSWIRERATYVSEAFLSLAEPCDDATLASREREVWALLEVCKDSSDGILSDKTDALYASIVSACSNAHRTAVAQLNITLQPVAVTTDERTAELVSRKRAELRDFVRETYANCDVIDDPASVALKAIDSKKPLTIVPSSYRLIQDATIIHGPYGGTCASELEEDTRRKTSESWSKRPASRILDFHEEFYLLSGPLAMEMSERVERSLVAAIPEIVERDLLVRLGETPPTLEALRVRKHLCRSTLEELRPYAQDFPYKPADQLTPLLHAEL